MTISIRSVAKSFGRYPALNNVSLDIADGGAAGPARPVGLGQDHPAARDRRPGIPLRRADLLRRRGHDLCQRRGAQGGLRVPAVRALPSYERGQEHRLRPGRAEGQGQAAARRDRPAGRGTAGPGGARRPRQALSQPAFRRPAPARGPGPRPRRGAGRAAAGRALRRPGRHGAQVAAQGAAPDPRRHRRDHDLRHPRPGGGAGAGRPGGDPEPWGHRAGRHAAGSA